MSLNNRLNRIESALGPVSAAESEESQKIRYDRMFQAELKFGATEEQARETARRAVDLSIRAFRKFGPGWMLKHNKHTGKDWSDLINEDIIPCLG